MTHHRAPGDRTTQDLALNRIGFHQLSLPSCPVCTGEVAERSPEAWALYNTYESIITIAVAVISAFENGLNPIRYLKLEEMAALAKTVLPHQSDFMDERGPSGAFFLLDEIKQKLLDELRAVLEGKKTDREQLQHATEIIKQAAMVSDVSTEQRLGLDAQIPEAIKADASE